MVGAHVWDQLVGGAAYASAAEPGVVHCATPSNTR